MSKVTSKFQVTVPKALADRHGIRPGDDITWESAGDVIHVKTGTPAPAGRSVDERLYLFDQASERLARRSEAVGRGRSGAADRGWSRDDLYRRGSPD